MKEQITQHPALGTAIVLESGIGHTKGDKGANVEIPNVGILYMSLCGPNEVSLLLNRMGRTENVDPLNGTLSLVEDENGKLPYREISVSERGDLLAISVLGVNTVQVDLIPVKETVVA